MPKRQKRSSKVSVFEFFLIQRSRVQPVAYLFDELDTYLLVFSHARFRAEFIRLVRRRRESHCRPGLQRRIVVYFNAIKSSSFLLGTC